MSANLKPGISRAKRLVMASRKPIATIISEQQIKHARLEERLGRLMSQRVEIEETIAELYEMLPRSARTT